MKPLIRVAIHPSDVRNGAIARMKEISEKNIPFAGTKINAAEPAAKYRITYWLYSNFYLPLMRFFNPVIHGCSIFTTKEMHYKIGGFQQDVTFEDFRYSKMAARYFRPVLLEHLCKNLSPALL